MPTSVTEVVVVGRNVLAISPTSSVPQTGGIFGYRPMGTAVAPYEVLCEGDEQKEARAVGRRKLSAVTPPKRRTDQPAPC